MGIGSFNRRKVVKKSRYWHRHGKHAKVDPHFTQNDRTRRDLTDWKGSIAELFRRDR